MEWSIEELKYRGLIQTGSYLPYNPDLVERAKWMRKNPTEAEGKLWSSFLKHQRVRILRQRPIDNFIADFYCPKLKLVIEIDGEHHHTKDGAEYDTERTSILGGYGLKVIRIKNTDIMNNFYEVCSKMKKIFSPL